MDTLFEEFPKIPRWSREVIVTEKIDGANAQIRITEEGLMLVGSRLHWITPEQDNFGFAAWAWANKDDLLKLGPGSHFGEWWGSGIQRGYGLKEKRFSLFNVSRWEDPAARPCCCSVVPVLWRGQMDELHLPGVLTDLRLNGSKAAPGFMRPEGVVIYHVAGRLMFKKTLEKDNEHKSQNKE